MASELQVNTITEATSGSGITFAKDVIPATPLSHRNLIINGGMTVAQRGTGFSSIHGDQYAADRFKFDCGSEDELRLSITRENSGPTGFSHSVRLNVTTAESAIAADEYARISTIIESQDLQHLDYGASGAKTTTVSFYVKSSLTGTYAMQLYQFDGPQTIGTTYTINAANTWEKKTITFVGNTSQAVANDNTAGIRLNWILMVGSDYTGTANSSWGAYSGGKFGNGHTAAWGTNTSHDFWLSGVQWELGSVATPFEHRSYAEELQKCYRYFYALHPKGGIDQYISNAWFYSASQVFSIVRHPVEMNHAPDVESSNVTNGFQLWKNGSLSFNSISKNGSTPYATNLYSAGFSGQTAGQSFGLYSDSNDSYIYLDSEI